MRMTQHAWGDFKAKLNFFFKKLHCIYLGFTSQVYDAAQLKCILCILIFDLHEMQLSPYSTCIFWT